MTTSAPPRPVPYPVRSVDELPWPSLLVLGTATLVMVTTEMLPAAVLAPMSTGLGVAEAQVARLVSLWATVVVLASFPLVRLTRGHDGRLVIMVGLIALAVSSGLTAVAPTYGAVIGARLLGAAAVGLLWATVNAFVADLVSDRVLGTAVAVVLGGATLGMVVGTPVARLVADLAGWRAAFAGLAAVGLAVAVLVRVIVGRSADLPADLPGERPGGAALLAKPGSPRPMLVLTGLVALVLVGHYGAYTFVTRLAEVPAETLPGTISTVLLVFGIASALGVALAGRIGDRSGRALLVSVVLTSVALLALGLVTAQPLLGLAVVVGWGVVSGAMPPLAQTQILRLAGPTHRATAGALIPVLFNGAIAIGAGLASLVVARSGVGALPVPAGAIVAVAAVGLAITVIRRHAKAR